MAAKGKFPALLAPIGGQIPPEYVWIDLARHLNTTPWALEEQGPKWLTWGAIHLAVTNRARAGVERIEE